MDERPDDAAADGSDDHILRELKQEQQKVRARARRLLTDYRAFIKGHPEGRPAFFSRPAKNSEQA